jgi:hypothetical protein
MKLNANYVILFTVVTLLSYLAMKAAFGDDSELCLRNCPAEQQKIEDMHQALEIWNTANCSVRDICTPANTTCIVPCVAPQIQKCDPDDETVNITGFCDPDDSDNGTDSN